MPATGAAARPPVLVDEDSWFEWVQVHTRELLIAAMVLVVAAAVVILYRSASATQAAQAEQALVGPEQAIQAGNIPLAQSDLRKLITRYSGTAAAAEAGMMLAATYYQQQKYADGVASLEHVVTTGAAEPFASAIERLRADGYVQQGKYREAATHFVAAAGKTRYPTEQARLRAAAARAYAAAGDTMAALAIWRQLATDTKSGEASEAQLLIGELTARPVKP